MKTGRVWGRLAGVMLSMIVGIAHAGTVWNEAANGDLSNDGLSPTPLAMTIGSNRVLGTVGNSGQGIDRDYFKLTVPAGATLTSIVLLANTMPGGVSFIGIQAGPQLTVTPSGGGSQNLLALGHYGSDQIGTDLLPTIEVGPAGPLPSGTYSIWVQETGGPAPYGLDFVITSSSVTVPALPDWGLIALAVLLGFFYWRHARRRMRAPL